MVASRYGSGEAPLKDRLYRLLTDLHRRHGPQEFGKLCQKLLAIAYRLAGFAHVVERGVQGVDVDAADGREKFATEVKTTQTSAVPFLRKDVDGLSCRGADGYQPVLGVLRLSPLSDWYLVDARRLRAGSLHIPSLRPSRLRDLEDRVLPAFDKAVEVHIEGAVEVSQAFLDGVLRQLGVEVRRV
jgi:hypothetical protein